MNCQEASELITAAVDGQLDDTFRRRLDQHLIQCTECRIALKDEQLTKEAIRRSMPRVQTPPAVVQAIRDQLAREEETRKSSDFAAPVRRRRTGWRAALSVASLLAIALMFLFLLPSRSTHSHVQPIDGNVVHQTYNHYDDFLSGKKVVESAPNDEAVLRTLLSGRAEFPVRILHPKNFTLLGGTVSNYANRTIAHLLYGSPEKTLLYVYQTKLVPKTAEFTAFSEEVATALNRAEWYSENRIPECTFVAWKIDSVICCAISDMPKEQLLASLQPEN